MEHSSISEKSFDISTIIYGDEDKAESRSFHLLQPPCLDQAKGIGEPVSPFQITRSKLTELVDPKNLELLDSIQGVRGLSLALCVDLEHGISTSPTYEDKVSEMSASLVQRKAVFGSNFIPVKNQRAFHLLVWDALHDRTLILLIVAALVSLGIGIYKDYRDANDGHGNSHSWIEAVAIMAAVILVVVVSSANDYQKEKQFRKLNAKKEDRFVKGIRDGVETLINIHGVVVGDILLLEPGDVVPADGVIIACYNLRCDESGATGESDSIKKGIGDPFVLSGTKVNEGAGKYIVTAVGPYSFHGKLLMSLQGVKEDTPLQMKLDRLANNIAKLGLSVSLLMLMTLTLKYVIQESMKKDRFADPVIVIDAITNIFIQAVTILVVAVPEGLPMAVTIALAFATARMLKDNNLVRLLAACETMGNATTICSDKTGTLTTNVMTVVKAYLCQHDCEKELQVKLIPKLLTSESLRLLIDSICINSTAFDIINNQGRVISIGSKTEIALLNMIKEFDVNIQAVRQSTRIFQLFPFSSERKSMTTIIYLSSDPNRPLVHHNLATGNNGEALPFVYRLFVKGAPEIILSYCDYYLDQHGTATAMTNRSRDEFNVYIRLLADQGLRTLALAYQDYEASHASLLSQASPPNERYVFIGIVGIEDPVRSGVPEAVLTCQRAGIFVRMVTGDNIATAAAIAKKCHILTRGGIILEGPRFRTLDEKTLTQIVPKLQVLARSSPLDKQILVRKLKEMNEVVAVTGDGTNDGPALMAADVGFSMGITGTEVAKEASSIILMDDNFTSIVKAVAWGRTVNDAVRKFLQFQLTVNVTAVVVAFISAIFDAQNHSILTAVQLLWINLLMDTMAALALATENPTPDILKRGPEGKKRSLVTYPMLKMIFGQSFFQIVVTLLTLHLGYKIFRLDPTVEMDVLTLRTIVFNTFVFLQIFNEFNCRVLNHSQFNIFKNLFHNVIFITIFCLSVLGQFLIVKFGGLAFNTVPLSWHYWVICILIAALSWPVAAIIKLMPNWRVAQAEDRVIYTKERLQWQAAITDIRHGLSVFNALRRPPPTLNASLVRTPSTSSLRRSVHLVPSDHE